MNNWESEFAWASFPTQVDWPTRGIRSGEGGADALEVVWGIGGSHSVIDRSEIHLVTWMMLV